MTAEVALALMLVIGAGLLASSLLRLYNSGTGFDPRGVENIAFSMDQQPLKGDALIEFYRHVGEGLGHQPGVKNVSFAWIIPFGHLQWDEDLSTADGKSHDIYQNSVAPAYFQTMRIPFFAGRDFRWDDSASTGQKIILNQAAARLLFPDRNPLGQFVTKKEGEKTFKYEVIGVVGDAKYEDVRSAAATDRVCFLTQNDPETRSYYAVVRTDGPAASLVGAAHALAEQIQPGIPRPEMTAMSDMVRDSMSAERMMALLAVFFAMCALMVTAIGLYGTLAFATARRTSEIGIRMALGARRAQVARMVFLQNAAVGCRPALATGVVAALLASRALASVSVRNVGARSMGLCGIHPGAGVHRQCSVFVARRSRRRHSAHGSHSLRVNARLTTVSIASTAFTAEM